jgi:hypothetical protein
MDKQDVLKLYGQHIYQIRLALAMQYVMVGATDPEGAFAKADKFIFHMLSDRHKEIKTS